MNLTDAPGIWSKRRDVDGDLSPALVSQLGSLVQSLAANPRRPRIIALVSPGRREGTTSCAVSLGRYLAARRGRVLMVDANAHDPALHRLSGVDQADGMTEVFEGDLSLERAVKPTSVPGLFVMTSGGPIADGQVQPPLLRDRIINSACDYDFILVDCPAVNVYEGSASIAAICEGVILVVEGGRTLRQSAKSAKQLLVRAGCNVLGVFINKRRYYIPQFLYDRL
jgi:Mrp family chromosome partitioning ATPase